MDTGAVLPIARINGALVGVQAGVFRQQGRVDVDHLPGKMTDKLTTQDPHVTRKDHQIRLILVYLGGQCAVKGFTITKVAGSQMLSGNTGFFGACQP